MENKECAGWIHNVIARREKGVTETEDGHDTIFDRLLEPNPDKNYEVPTIEQLVDEAFFLIVAGGDSTAYSMACTTYHILSNKESLTRLKKELKLLPRRSDGHLDLKNVMDLPYLVIHLLIAAFLPAIDSLCRLCMRMETD